MFEFFTRIKLHAALIFCMIPLHAAGQASFQNTEDLRELLDRMDSGDPGYGNTIHDLALSYKAEGYFSLAKETFLEGLAYYKDVDSLKSTEYALMMADLGELYWEKGELTIAKDLLSDSENILKDNPENESSEAYLRLKMNLATADAKLGNHLSAMVGFRQARTLFERKFEDQKSPVIQTILQIADVYSEIENLQRAESFYDEAEDQLSTLEIDHEELHISLLRKRAQYHAKVEDLESAIQQQKEAVEIILTTHGKTSTAFAEAEAELGKFYLMSRQMELAQSSLDRSLQIQATVFGTYHRKYLKTLSARADLYRMVRNVEKAFEVYTQVIGKEIETFTLLSPVMGNQEKTDYYLTISDLLNKYASLAENEEDIRSKVLGKLIDFRFIINDLNLHPPIQLDPDNKDHIEWRNKTERLLYLYKQPQSQITGGAETIQEIQKEIQTLEKKLIRRNEFEIKRGHEDRSNWKDIQKFMRDGEVAIEITRYPWYSKEDLNNPSNEIHYMFISFDRNSELPDGYLITNGNELENRFLSHYRNSVNHKFLDDYAYEMYWLPVRDNYKDYSTIFLSPSGAYSQINLLTLRNVETNKYLIDESRIVLVTSITHYNLDVESGIETDNVVHIFGNADYNLPIRDENKQLQSYEIYTSEQGESGIHYMRDKIKQQILWNELLYIDDVKVFEVGLLDDLYKSEGFSTFLYTQNTARESEIKKLQSPKTLHISTHGYFMEDDDINSGAYLDNQLLHSGLVFSGSYDYLDSEDFSFIGEDGLLTSYEISQLQLQETELVFLSSCETGLGIVNNGNAISNFQHAFQEAGTESLIMTLWTIEAEYQLEFMGLFYYHWLFENMPKREAFLQSVRIMKNSYEIPYYWGSFIFIGE